MDDKIEFLIAHNKVLNIHGERVDFAPFCYQAFKYIFFLKFFGDYIEGLHKLWSKV